MELEQKIDNTNMHIIIKLFISILLLTHTTCNIYSNSQYSYVFKNKKIGDNKPGEVIKIDIKYGKSNFHKVYFFRRVLFSQLGHAEAKNKKAVDGESWFSFETGESSSFDVTLMPYTDVHYRINLDYRENRKIREIIREGEIMAELNKDTSGVIAEITYNITWQ